MICACSICQAQVKAEERRKLDREELDRSLAWQFAMVSKDRAARGARALTYSEWLAGCFEEEENGDVAMESNRHGPLAIIAALLFITAVIIALTACQTPATRTETVEVKVPVAVQPIKPADVPTPPAPLPKRPSSLSAAADVLLSKVCELESYVLRADPLLRVSAGLPPQELPKYPECEGR